MTAQDRSSLLVLTCRGAPQYALVNALARSHDIKGVVFEQRLGLKLRLLRRRLRKLGMVTVANQLLFKVIDALLLQTHEGPEASRMFGKDAVFDRSRVPNATVLDIESVNAEPVRELCRQIQPDVVVVSGTSLLGRELLASLDSTPVINIHCGITPRYRGNHGAYWAVVNGDWENAGTTVHLIDAGIDTGAIIGQTVIEVEASDTPGSLALKQQAAGIPLMLEAISRVLAGNLTILERADLDSRIYSSPTLTSYMRYKKRMKERFSTSLEKPVKKSNPGT